MSFREEPSYRHGQAARTGVLLVNLGSPSEPTAKATRRYLAQFLSDPRVVEIPRYVWQFILHGIILRVRPAKSAAKYATIWTPEGSPLVAGTARLSKLLLGSLGEAGMPILVRHAMRYGEPSVDAEMNALRAEGATRVLVIPLYPQYAAATTASVIDAVAQWAQKARYVPELRFVNRYHDNRFYIRALAEDVRKHWAREGRGKMLVMSFHGVPQRSLTLGDPYHCECYKTARLLAQELSLADSEFRVTFQSRFGRAKWLEPYTEPTLVALAQSGTERVDVICPGFAVDCLETLEEIAQEARDAFVEAGGRDFHYIPCLNDSPAHVRALVDVVQQHIQGWPAPPAQASAELQLSRERALAVGAPD
ncbi:MAG: ferrochelatase, partial [Rubrivivax sp.]|jgi:ferrochelatase